jgi:hypothetical protein
MKKTASASISQAATEETRVMRTDESAKNSLQLATEKLKNEVKDLILQLERNRDDEDSSPSRRTQSGFAGIDTRTRQEVEDEIKGFEKAILDNENQVRVKIHLSASR